MHRLTAAAVIALAPVLLGHIVIASGLFPGYRGVWRSIHWRGELPRETAARLWAEMQAKPKAGRSGRKRGSPKD